jgi:hypothetical protein
MIWQKTSGVDGYAGRLVTPIGKAAVWTLMRPVRLL